MFTGEYIQQEQNSHSFKHTEHLQVKPCVRSQISLNKLRKTEISNMLSNYNVTKLEINNNKKIAIHKYEDYMLPNPLMPNRRNLKKKFLETNEYGNTT